ncbi:MAG: 2-amino-4-hydroxy-6-hydroxymethyldihydropteridine diphosphokinase [Candidatus Dadabacteria bacterium]|nr:2-amino-4-hydroxy-6-hydroxymethyldihydropteridine diphosphokinase [Candidatus Dadabacteria bacterium]
MGSNLGDRTANCMLAVSMLSAFARVTAVSSVYETEPVGPKDQPDFINCAACIETDIPPEGLLAELRSIEDALGRVRSGRWRERSIDLDIVFYDGLIMNTDALTIPHPRAHLRRFVLEPLAEISPGLVHPVLGVTVSGLLGMLKGGERVVKTAPPSVLFPQKPTGY